MGQIRWIVLSKFVSYSSLTTHPQMHGASHAYVIHVVRTKKYMIVLIIAEKRKKKKLFSRLIHFFSFKEKQYKEEI